MSAAPAPRKRRVPVELVPTILRVRHFQARKDEPAFLAVPLSEHDRLTDEHVRLREQIKQLRAQIAKGKL